MYALNWVGFHLQSFDYNFYTLDEYRIYFKIVFLVIDTCIKQFILTYNSTELYIHDI